VEGQAPTPERRGATPECTTSRAEADEAERVPVELDRERTAVLLRPEHRLALLQALRDAEQEVERMLREGHLGALAGRVGVQEPARLHVLGIDVIETVPHDLPEPDAGLDTRIDEVVGREAAEIDDREDAAKLLREIDRRIPEDDLVRAVDRLDEVVVPRGERGGGRVPREQDARRRPVRAVVSHWRVILERVGMLPY